MWCKCKNTLKTSYIKLAFNKPCALHLVIQLKCVCECLHELKKLFVSEGVFFSPQNCIWENHFPPLQSLLDYHRIGSNFWRFYLIRIGFTFDELVSLVKVFRLFRSEWIFVVFGVWTQWVDVQHIIYWHGQCVCDALFLIKIISCFPKTIIILVTILFSNLFGFGIQIPTSWSVNK